MTETIEAKPWWKSLTVWSGLLTVLTSFGFAGLAFDPLTGDFNGNVYELGASLSAFLSGAGAIYGRIRARVRVGA